MVAGFLVGRCDSRGLVLMECARVTDQAWHCSASIYNHKGNSLLRRLEVKGC